jgi:hypothetical protein
MEVSMSEDMTIVVWVIGFIVGYLTKRNKGTINIIINKKDE